MLTGDCIRLSTFQSNTNFFCLNCHGHCENVIVLAGREGVIFCLGGNFYYIS